MITVIALVNYAGNEPIVVSRGGFSGLFPEGTPNALAFAKDTTILCNLQLTKDGGAFCVTGATLDRSTTINDFDPNKTQTYNINGKNVEGYFAVDYTTKDIDQNVFMVQSIYTRPDFYDASLPVLNVDAVLSDKSPPQFWLNVQYQEFYTQRGVKFEDRVVELVSQYQMSYVSSPEIGFLKSINGKVSKTSRIIFQLLGANETEPTTKQTYGAIVKDLVAIKSYASGIMVTKEYIWPVKADNYLGLPTTLVTDAHKLGLEVYASGFANDFTLSFNYSYDPTAEFLQFTDKGDSVDGVVTDFPATASNAIACFANNQSLPKKGPTLIISNNGATGVYPGSTDLAYQQAIDDGADIIDCSVQMSKDGIAFCSGAADLIQETTAVTKFMPRTSTVPEVQPKSGIFSFDLAWSEIQTLKPQIYNPEGQDFPRNPAEKNSGKFVTLTEFLELAKTKAVPGILINIQNAAFLASNRSLDIVGAVSSALSNASFDEESTKQVLIQSDDSQVLTKFKDIPSYKRVLLVADKIGDIPRPTADEIKKYADAVNLAKGDVFSLQGGGSLLGGMTNVVKELKDANLTVFVHNLKNEFISLAFDFWSDPNIAMATFIQTAKVDGIVTDFPATASRYMRSPCSDPNHVPSILPAQPGDLMSTVDPQALPPAEAPFPSLEVADVVDPPLPAVINSTKDEQRAPTPAPSSSARTNNSNFGLSLVVYLVFALIFSRH
ncbi:hypothetical protein PIB30_013938 [Stylosanthes scabra]|uniref:glycerophosphodiester phosphodiesterase n=1 Tax=Stylosanthes scabra TaxID=79078 RepID=A0ABU6W4N1_9FABA|nr:hypothetical protein [Stylosanthes scabra]